MNQFEGKNSLNEHFRVFAQHSNIFILYTNTILIMVTALRDRARGPADIPEWSVRDHGSGGCSQDLRTAHQALDCASPAQRPVSGCAGQGINVPECLL